MEKRSLYCRLLHKKNAPNELRAFCDSLNYSKMPDRSISKLGYVCTGIDEDNEYETISGIKSLSFKYRTTIFL